jgi:hypothetical protein
VVGGQVAEASGGEVIFDLIRDHRSRRFRLASILISLAINVLLLLGLVVFSQVSALRQSYGRLSFDLTRELGRYRVLLITPRITPPATTRDHEQRPGRKPVVKPLTTPDPRLLYRLDPQLQEFAAENRAIEEIFTREIVRDVDSKVLDLRRLFEKSSLEVSFEVGAQGNLDHKRIDISSGVPSIDHLALEIVGLVEKYHLAWVFQGFSRVVLLIRTGEDVEIRLSCTPRDPESQESLAKRIQGTLTLARIAAAQSDAAFLLRDVSVTPEEDKVTLSRTLSKDPLARFLMRYWQSESPQ